MNIYPAIDLYEGKVVRLKRGDYSQKIVYSEDPVKVAQEWERQGAVWLHIVDLEGAKTGVLKNKTALSNIRKAVRCQIQYGGGLRTLKQIRWVLDLGVGRIVIGTRALEKKFFTSVLKTYAHQVAVGLDVRDGILQTRGWLESGRQTLLGAVVHFNLYPVETLIYTDIQKDGMLEGPNFVTLRDMLKIAKAKIIVSGGVGKLEDIRECAKIKEKNFEGVVVGKALYDQRFTLKEALDCFT